MAFVIFVLVKFMNTIENIGKKNKVEEKVIKKSDEVLLLEEIRDLLKAQNKSKKHCK